MDEVMCPNCGTTKYRNPSLRLLINTCGHSFCEKCVEILFNRGSATCYECKTSLRKANFRYQLFDDPLVDKEVNIRKKITKELNVLEEDFSSLREYNDFLEQIEDIIFNLANNVDIETTKERIEQLKSQYKTEITKNRHKLSRDQVEIRKQIQVEKENSEEIRKRIAREEMIAQMSKAEIEKQLLDDLQFSDKPTGLIMTDHQEKQINTLYKKQDEVTFDHENIEDFDEVAMYHYEKPVIFTEGPLVPLENTLEFDDYTAHVISPSDVEFAGGYNSSLACSRALGDAFNSLFL